MGNFTCDVPHSFIRLDSIVCVTRLIRVCDMSLPTLAFEHTLMLLHLSISHSRHCMTLKSPQFYHACVCACVDIEINTCIRVSIYLYMYICMYMCLHISIHTFTRDRDIHLRHSMRDYIHDMT